MFALWFDTSVNTKYLGWGENTEGYTVLWSVSKRVLALYVRPGGRNLRITVSRKDLRSFSPQGARTSILKILYLYGISEIKLLAYTLMEADWQRVASSEEPVSAFPFAVRVADIQETEQKSVCVAERGPEQRSGGEKQQLLKVLTTDHLGSELALF